MLPILLYLIIDDISQTRKKIAEMMTLKFSNEKRFLGSVINFFSSKVFMTLGILFVIFWPVSFLLRYFRNKQIAYNDKLKTLAEKAKIFLLRLAAGSTRLSYL